MCKDCKNNCDCHKQKSGNIFTEEEKHYLITQVEHDLEFVQDNSHNIENPENDINFYNNLIQKIEEI